MSEQTFEELFEEQETVRIHNGSVVTGVVIDVKDNEAVLNIGYKSDGILLKSEFSKDPDVDLKEALHVGDEITVKVLKVNDGDGQVALSAKRVNNDKPVKALEDAFEAKTPLTGKVESAVPAGLSVACEGTTVFIPASLVSDTFERNLDKYVGEELEFILIEYNVKKHRVVGDRKSLIVERKEKALAELMETLQVGQVVEGTVKSVRQYGAFIDLGGADGLLHVSEMTWGRIDNPGRLFKVGQKVEAFVKEINEEEKKIALSVKFPDQDPWTDDSPYAVGKTITGKVARLTDFGAFVPLQDGIDALIHVSQIAHEHIEKPADVLKVGQEITAVVIDFNPETCRISASIKELLPKPEKTEEAEEATETEEAVEAETAKPEEAAEPEQVEDEVTETPFEEAETLENEE